MLNIDSFAYTNRLRHVHPLEKAAFALSTMFLCIGFTLPVISIAVIIIMAFAMIVLARIPTNAYLKLMSIPFSFLLIGVLTIAVSFSAQTISGEQLMLVKVFGINVGISHAGLYRALELFLKSLGAVSCLYFLSLTTPVVEMVAIMRKLKFPSLFIELTDLTYRFIFVMLVTADKIYTSQSTRWGYSSMKNSMKSLGKLTASMFVKALNRSQELFTALSSRGYTGQINVLTPQCTVSISNIILITVIETTLAVTAILLEMGKVG